MADVGRRLVATQREPTMKVLTVKQPWAWAMANGIKRIENRTRATRYRGPLLIHAGVSKSDLGKEGTLIPGLPDRTALTFGAIIGVADVVDCVPLEMVKGEPFAWGPFCWILANARPLKPYPCKGRLSLWPPPAGWSALGDR
jgi:ASCH domain